MRRHPPPSPSLPPNQQLIRGERWPVVGEKTPRIDDSPWTVSVISGDRRIDHPLDELRCRPQTQRIIDVHCVTRWSKPAMRFGGIPLGSLLADIPRNGKQFVSFTARSQRNHTTSLPLNLINEFDPLIAFTANDQPLSVEHGGPVRVVMPGRYFYKSIKWLERIELLEQDRLGYWEAEAGYHNGADPWKEERYLAPTLSKQDAKRLLDSGMLPERDLRGLVAAGRTLSHLKAENARLRHADFSRCTLHHANFRGANLSNANFRDADLQHASFCDADLEGADFAGADLRGADLRGASLFGASFGDVIHLPSGEVEVRQRAKQDTTTQFSEENLAALTDEQKSLLASNE